MSNTLRAIISIGVCLAVGAVSGLFTADAIPTWFTTIQKPSWNPPNWLFGPVWTTLYVLMGIAFFLVWRSPNSADKSRAMWAFGTQLVLNFFWSFIFFKQQNISGAFIEILFMLAAIVATIVLFSKVNRTAAWLLAPYLAWVSFASFLNFTIWQLNK